MCNTGQELTALTVTLCARVSITLCFTNKVDNVTIRFDYCPVWTISSNWCLNFKPTWKFREVANFIDVVEVPGKLFFYLGVKWNVLVKTLLGCGCVVGINTLFVYKK